MKVFIQFCTLASKPAYGFLLDHTVHQLWPKIVNVLHECKTRCCDFAENHLSAITIIINWTPDFLQLQSLKLLTCILQLWGLVSLYHSHHCGISWHWFESLAKKRSKCTSAIKSRSAWGCILDALYIIYMYPHYSTMLTNVLGISFIQEFSFHKNGSCSDLILNKFPSIREHVKSSALNARKKIGWVALQFQ